MFEGLKRLFNKDEGENPYASPCEGNDEQKKTPTPPQKTLDEAEKNFTRDEKVRLEIFGAILEWVPRRIERGDTHPVSFLLWERIKYLGPEFELNISASRRRFIELMKDQRREVEWLKKGEFDDHQHPAMRMMYSDILASLNDMDGAQDQYGQAMRLVREGGHVVIE